MPATFDLPWEALQTYRGSSPRPDDFDAYWSRALSEIASVAPAPEIIPAGFETSFAICSHLTFAGVGGARIHAKLLQPRNVVGQGPAVLQFHGYGGNSGNWFDKLCWVAEGFTVAALDCRGQGGLSEDTGGVKGNTLRGHVIRGLDGNPEDLLYRQLFLDTAQLARVVLDMPGVDAGRVAAMGGSQGGGLALACAALEPRIRAISAFFPFLCDYRRVWKMDMVKEAYAELQTYFRSNDPLHEREDAVFTRLGYIDVQNLAERIRGHVLFATALMDTTCPPSSQFAVYNKITAPKTLRVYPDFGHEFLPGNDDAVFTFIRQQCCSDKNEG
jgi:cephalosporin-C deacetylase